MTLAARRFLSLLPLVLLFGTSMGPPASKPGKPEPARENWSAAVGANATALFAEGKKIYESGGWCLSFPSATALLRRRAVCRSVSPPDAW